ncbi:alpha-(1,3)-fucosyltransferase C-like [Ruditapes philippinarum]|uniref:alpha-(1,3)-fucosyltransferase C-like n=1 Tax=Ruditapes philippinarum TaxID=129788 RepID=UPI00295C39B8|nr:alpha-(1,3)-fucosyltransferase C-like [Ruditapes philippinarum]
MEPEILRFQTERQNVIDRVKELLERNPEDSDLHKTLDDLFRQATELSNTKQQSVERDEDNINDSRTLKNFRTSNKGKDSQTNRITVNDQIKIIAYFPRQIRLSKEIDAVDMSVCSVTNCNVHRMTAEINGTILDADAVLIQGNRMPKHLPTRRDCNQVFVFLNNEPPLYIQMTDLSNEMFVNYFNWTMTYRTDSDIPFLYGTIVSNDEQNYTDYLNNVGRKRRNELHINKDLDKDYSALYKQKDKGVFWIVSHCSTKSKREKYVDKMRENIKVDQFGGCNENKIARKTYYSTENWTRYKFYLAFENTYCIDYLTEKVYNWFELDIILVVRGGCDYTKFLPNGTYVDANNFENAAALSNYLNELGANKTEYINFLKRKDTYRVYKEQEMVQSSFCNLCEKLNNVNDNIKSVENIYKWWQQDACWNIKNPL